jgi:hypothetical protein
MPSLGLRFRRRRTRIRSRRRSTWACLANHNSIKKAIIAWQNAVAYFNPSSEIKFADKRTIRGKLRLPKYRHEFREFLLQNVNQAYIR